MDRIDTISYSEERPFDLGHNEEAWDKNRRAHFVVREGMNPANSSKPAAPSQMPRDRYPAMNGSLFTSPFYERISYEIFSRFICTCRGAGSGLLRMWQDTGATEDGEWQEC